jgi:hypothetical protein
VADLSTAALLHPGADAELRCEPRQVLLLLPLQTAAAAFQDRRFEQIR